MGMNASARSPNLSLGMFKFILGASLAGLVLPLLSGCSSSEASHAEEVDAWHRARTEELRQPDGWLALVGLYWLEEGQNRFGSSPDNDLVFPRGTPAHMGSFVVHNGTVRAVIADGILVSSEGEPVDQLVMQTSDDDEAEPTPLSWESLTWILIERDGRLAVRVKDSESPALAAFDGIERFPVSPDWRIEAGFDPYIPPKTIEIPTVMGTVSQQTTPGRVVFQVDGTAYSIDVTGEPGDEEYFVIFADETNGTETYPAGRYLWIDAPHGGEGGVVVDFNKSYNPPCVFTPYATCPFPPPQNRLRLRVDAGEKNFEAGIQIASTE